jgi:hypothetical protein
VVIPELINHRRRVVYSSLLQVISDTSRAQSLFILLNPYVETEEHFVASRVADVASQSGRMSAEERVPFTRALMQNMRLSYEQLLRYPDHLVKPTLNGHVLGENPAKAAPYAQPVPFPQVAKQIGQQAGQPQPPAPTSALRAPVYGDPARPATVVFRYVLAGLLEPLRQIADLGEIIIEIALQTEHKAMVRLTLQPWLKTGLAVEAIAGNLSQQQMHGIINIVYLTACDLLGPVEADRLLSTVVGAAKGLPEAKEFAPEKLL